MTIQHWPKFVFTYQPVQIFTNYYLQFPTPNRLNPTNQSYQTEMTEEPSDWQQLRKH